MKISQCFGVNLKTVQRIWKELNKSNGDTEGTAALKTRTDRSSKKRTVKLVGQNQANDLSKSIRSIARDIGMFQFLI